MSDKITIYGLTGVPAPAEVDKFGIYFIRTPSGFVIKIPKKLDGTMVDLELVQSAIKWALQDYLPGNESIEFSKTDVSTMLDSESPEGVYYIEMPGHRWHNQYLKSSEGISELKANSCFYNFAGAENIYSRTIGALSPCYVVCDDNKVTFTEADREVGKSYLITLTGVVPDGYSSANPIHFYFNLKNEVGSYVPRISPRLTNDGLYFNVNITLDFIEEGALFNITTHTVDADFSTDDSYTKIFSNLIASNNLPTGEASLYLWLYQLGATYNIDLTKLHCEVKQNIDISGDLYPAPLYLQEKEIKHDEITVEWQFVSGGEYEVRMREKDTLLWTVENAVNSGEQKFDGLDYSTEYEFQVRRKFGSIFSEWTNTLTLKTLMLPFPVDALVFEVNTELIDDINTDTPDDSYHHYLSGMTSHSVDMNIHWDWENNPENFTNVTSTGDSGLTHQYPAPGIYIVVVMGQNGKLPLIYGRIASLIIDKAKPVRLLQLGNVPFTGGNSGSSFYNRVNLVLDYEDEFKINPTGSLANTFRNTASGWTGLKNLDVSGVTSFNFLYLDADGAEVNEWDYSPNANFNSTTFHLLRWYDPTDYDTMLKTLHDIFVGEGKGITFTFRSTGSVAAKYTATGKTFRDALVLAGYTIIDGGQV